MSKHNHLFFVSKGDIGPVGPTGPQGIKGERGDKGEKVNSENCCTSSLHLIRFKSLR